MASIAKKSVLWITVSFLCFVLILAARNGAAQLFLSSARGYMDVWVEQKRGPNESEYANVKSQLEWAVSLADADPIIREQMARLSTMRAATLTDIGSRRLTLRFAVHETHVALALNPVSAYHWTQLLVLKRELGEFDDEFRNALHRAVELGPWEPTLLVVQADVGMSAWKEMPQEEQAIIQQIFIRGMQRQSKAMRAVAQAHRPACAEGMKCQ